MNDLDQIAINDMKHELCDTRPCRDCAKFAYTVRSNGTALGTYYVRNEAFHFASILVKSLYGKAEIRVDVYDLNDDPQDPSCHYTFDVDGNPTKVG